MCTVAPQGVYVHLKTLHAYKQQQAHFVFAFFLLFAILSYLTTPWCVASLSRKRTEKRCSFFQKRFLLLLSSPSGPRMKKVCYSCRVSRHIPSLSFFLRLILVFKESSILRIPSWEIQSPSAFEASPRVFSPSAQPFLFFSLKSIPSKKSLYILSLHTKERREKTKLLHSGSRTLVLKIRRKVPPRGEGKTEILRSSSIKRIEKDFRGIVATHYPTLQQQQRESSPPHNSIVTRCTLTTRVYVHPNLRLLNQT